MRFASGAHQVRGFSLDFRNAWTANLVDFRRFPPSSRLFLFGIPKNNCELRTLRWRSSARKSPENMMPVNARKGPFPRTSVLLGLGPGRCVKTPLRTFQGVPPFRTRRRPKSSRSDSARRCLLLADGATRGEFAVRGARFLRRICGARRAPPAANAWRADGTTCGERARPRCPPYRGKRARVTAVNASSTLVVTVANPAPGSFGRSTMMTGFFKSRAASSLA